ncbi:MAG TPA: response regulator [Rectinemataceae bacterium]|nr:response regulator [Rectinemataceae bacterium]
MSDREERQRILVVDDQASNLRILVELLKSHFELTVATSGEQAIERLRTAAAPDLVLLDIVMPGMDGYEVCARIMADPGTRGIPVIFLSSLDAAADESRGLALGAVDYISKPFAPAIILARIRNHLELKRHRDDLEALIVERTREVELT